MSGHQLIQPLLESKANKVVLLRASSRHALKVSMDGDPPGNLFQCFTHHPQSEKNASSWKKRAYGCPLSPCST